MPDGLCRILLIEDNPADARLIWAMFRSQPAPEQQAAYESYEVVHAERLLQGLERLGSEKFDVILLDLSLPESEGIETFNRVHNQAPNVPIVVLTGFGDVSTAVQALQSGAQDYLVKGTVDNNLLVRSVRYAIERHRMRTEADRQAQTLELHMQRLQEGFQKLAAGDLSIRVSEGIAEDNAHPELSKMLQTFDQTVEKLQYLSELKSQFYSMVTHDLRSPLSTILLTTRTMTGFNASEKERGEAIDIIQRKATYLLSLVDSLLEVFFLQSGQLKLLRQRVDANELVSRCASELAKQASIKNQTLAVEAMEGNAEIWCDQNKLFRVLENLVSNAIKYSDQNDTIRIRVSAEDPEHVRFEVIDRGPGLKPDDQRKIFEPFYRTAAHANRAKGTGLGLTIAKEFVNAHGGTLTVRSAPGEGATFSFLIPRNGTIQAELGA